MMICLLIIILFNRGDEIDRIWKYDEPQSKPNDN